jgi:hypothetical protein
MTEPLTPDEMALVRHNFQVHIGSAVPFQLARRLVATVEALTAELANERMFGSDQSDNGPWGQIVRLVTSQRDWNEELTDGPGDIVAYLREALRRPTTSRVRNARRSKRHADQKNAVLAAEVRAVTARLDAAQPLIDAAIRHSDNIHGVHAENRQAVRDAVAKYRAATAAPTPQTETPWTTKP